MSEVSRVRSLLAQAVQCLDGETSSSAGRSDAERSNHSVRVPGPPSARTSSASRISALAERNCLFNFSKRSGGPSSSGRRSKKKRLEMWNHDFVCLANRNRKKTPTSMERATLTSKGKISKCSHNREGLVFIHM